MKNTPTNKPRGLGRGLDALIPGGNHPRASKFTLPISRIRPNPKQPRTRFNQERLESLAGSIQEVGLLQAIVVRPDGDSYSIVAGERRYRACKKLGWQEVPVTIQDLDDVQTFTIALIENLQREDLNPLEEARGYAELIEAASLTQQQAADKVGVSRSALTNKLRLLALPGQVQVMIEDGQLTEGHGRSLLGFPENRVEEIARWAADTGATVRAIEKLAKQPDRAEQLTTGKTPSHETTIKAGLVEKLGATLGKILATPVQIKPHRNGQGGKIVLSYTSDEQLQQISEILARGKNNTNQ